MIQGLLATVWCLLLLPLVLALSLDTASLVPAYLSRLEHPSRSLGQAAVPDCGRAFQPCCPSGDVCKDGSLSCISRDPLPRCEPCGTPFAQPCPVSPFCEAEGLIPTTRRSDINIQCRPCGFEWQPCCAMLGSLCTGGFTCYAEQDRCVVPEYTYVKEEFFPDLIPVGSSASPICGGLNDPPCMEPSPQGPKWQCEDGLVTHIPVFLCMTDTTIKTDRTHGCGRNLQHPCQHGCLEGLTLVVDLTKNEPWCLKTFSLTSDTDLEVSMPGQNVNVSKPFPLPQAQVPPSAPPSPPPVVLVPVSDAPQSQAEKPDGCGTKGASPCAAGCKCGLKVGADGKCMEDPDGCLDSSGLATEVPVNHTTPSQEAAPTEDLQPGIDIIEDQSTDAADDQPLCGSLDAKPCNAPRVRPCECGLYLEESSGTCAAEISAGPCPVRPYCGFDGGPPCSFPGDQPCDECLEVDPISAICIRNPNCVRDDAIDDQSFRCGRLGTMPCASPPFCKKNLAVGKDGKCVRCGHQTGAIPCTTHPACKGRRTSNVEGVAFETCENCGGIGEPPCSDKLSDPPCDVGLYRSTLSPGDERTLVNGQKSVCTVEKMEGQCGFVGQKPCDGICLGRSVPSEDNQICIECGSASQGTCSDSDRDRCDDGLEEYRSSGQKPVCLCSDSVCAGPSTCLEDGTVIDQTGTGGRPSLGAEVGCGSLGEPRCEDEPNCEERLFADEDGICHPCGEAEGAFPCPDEPQCGYRLTLNSANDFCTACGGEMEPVCCTSDGCSEEDPFDTPCSPGLKATGVLVDSDLDLRSPAGEVHCSKDKKSGSCGKVGESPCVVDDEVDEDGNSARPCRGLSTPSADGLKCTPCGRAGQPPCVNRFKLCTGKLVAVFNQDKPDVCVEQPQAQAGGVADQSTDRSECGTSGQPWCKNTPTPCIGRTIAVAGNFCAACGGAGQFACTNGSPCNGTLRHYRNQCIACGAAGQVVCGRRGMGKPCSGDLTADRGRCKKLGIEVVEVQSAKIGFGASGCGRSETEPCPGQPACGNNLFLIKREGQIICSERQPTKGYPQGDDCGGTGQPLCNEAPHCRTGLHAVLPEGICIPQEPNAVACGSLGNKPCKENARCQPGLIPSLHKADCRPGQEVCAPVEQVPCGIRGFPICLGEQALCNQLLVPSFPEMVCIDSARSETQSPCGVLGATACIGLACTSPLVVQPSTAVCVPPRNVPCGGLQQPQCFWDGRGPCQEGLLSENGICRR